jgi:hypothetical protein
MLPDFPRIKNGIQEIIKQELQNQIRQEPFLSQFKVKQVFEGNKMSIKTENGELDQINYKEIYSKHSIDREDVIMRGPIVFMENIQSMAEEIIKQETRNIFSKFNDITKKTGKVVNGKGDPFTHDLLLELLEKIQIDFDDQGNPYMPALVVPPNIFSKLKEKLPEWEANPEYKRKFEEIINKKRREWHDRESHRKLVD